MIMVSVITPNNKDDNDNANGDGDSVNDNNSKKKNKNNDNNIKTLYCFERSDGCSDLDISLHIVASNYRPSSPSHGLGAGVLGRPDVSKQITA